MTIPQSWSAEAFNQVPESDNRIHSDEVARAYGFRGALVPGVTVSAYLLHPAAVAWGHDWLERGRAHVVVHSPVYDTEKFQVEIDRATADAYDAHLVDERGAKCATAAVSLPASVPAPPAKRDDALLSREAAPPTASREVMEGFRETELGALAVRWDEAAEITRYLRDSAAMAPVYCEERFANPAFVLGLTNWVLGRNVKMSPWLHLQTDSQHYGAIAPGTDLVVEASIADLFEKKGHEFVDVDVEIYPKSEDVAVASVRLRAIYKLRTP